MGVSLLYPEVGTGGVDEVEVCLGRRAVDTMRMFLECVIESGTDMKWNILPIRGFAQKEVMHRFGSQSVAELSEGAGGGTPGSEP